MGYSKPTLTGNKREPAMETLIFRGKGLMCRQLSQLQISISDSAFRDKATLLTHAEGQYGVSYPFEVLVLSPKP